MQMRRGERGAAFNNTSQLPSMGERKGRDEYDYENERKNNGTETKGLVLKSQSSLYSTSHWHMKAHSRKVWKGQESREILVLPYCRLDIF